MVNDFTMLLRAPRDSLHALLFSSVWCLSLLSRAAQLQSLFTLTELLLGVQ